MRNSASYLLHAAALSCFVHPWTVSSYSWICAPGLQGLSVQLEQEIALTGKHTDVTNREN